MLLWNLCANMNLDNWLIRAYKKKSVKETEADSTLKNFEVSCGTQKKQSSFSEENRVSGCKNDFSKF